jgi:uncharacterized membrane protein YdjX (TVP38/TMEM64 family)
MNPLNVASYIAGFSQMSLKAFVLASMVGCLPEILLYSFLGSHLLFQK